MFCQCCDYRQNVINNPKRKPEIGRFPNGQKLAYGIMKCKRERKEEFFLSLELSIFNIYKALLIAAKCGFF